MNQFNANGNNATSGCIIDYRNFPTVRVKVENPHSFWTKITVLSNSGVTKHEENIWAKFGYIAPKSYAEYSLTFNYTNNSYMQFFVNASTLDPILLTMGTRFIDTFAPFDWNKLGLPQLINLLQALKSSQHMLFAAEALIQLDFDRFVEEFAKALGDDTNAYWLSSALAEIGVHVSSAFLKNILTVWRIYQTITTIWDTVSAAMTGSTVGSVMFVSQRDVNPPITPPPPTPQGGTPSDDQIPPSGSWITPNNLDTISTGSVNLSVNATDNAGGSGVNMVRFSALWEGVWSGIHVATEAPYSISWDWCAWGVPDGDVELGIEVWDNAGNGWVYSDHFSNYHVTKNYSCPPEVTPIPGVGLVSNLNDSGAGSLRQVIEDANNGATIFVGVTGTLTLTTPLYIDKHLMITGPGSSALTIDDQGGINVAPDVYVTLDGLGFSGYPIGNYGDLTVLNTTFHDTLYGALINWGNLTVLNSTFSNNYGSYSFPTTAVIQNTAGTTHVSFSTFADTMGEYDLYVTGGTLVVKNSILGGNNGSGACLANGGTLTAAGTNLSAAEYLCPGFSITDSNPLLGLLANNSGSTLTHALIPGSPAINAAADCTDVDGNLVATDQRGNSRPFGTACDLGAYEASTSAGMPGADLIFRNGFENGSFSAWSSMTGNLSANTFSSMVGGYDMVANASGGYVTDDSPNAEPRYRARFYFDPSSVTMANNDNFAIFYGFQGTTTAMLQVQLRRSGGTYQLRTAALNDGGTWLYSGWTTISDAPHMVEIDWQAASAAGANNGSLNWWLDEAARTALTTLDMDTRRVDRVRLGAVAGMDAGTNGAVLFDEFEARRTSYIGAVTFASLAPRLISPSNDVLVERNDPLTLTWNGLGSGVQYDVELTNGSDVSVNSGWIAGTSWSAGSQPGGVYTWRVKARNSGAVESLFSAVRTLTILPAAPTNLQGGGSSAAQIDLHWTASVDAPTHISGYNIYRDGVSIGSVGSSTTQYSDSQGIACTTYRYVVRAMHVSGFESQASNELEAFPVLCDALFSDGFESGSLGAWTSSATDGGNLSVTGSAALTGSFGLQALINDASPLYVTDDTPNAEKHYWARFSFDPNALVMANNDNLTIFYGQSTTTAMLQVQLQRSGGTYQLRTAARDDGGTWFYSGWSTISDAPHKVEIDWQAASAAGASNGTLNWWLDEAAQTPLSGLDNDTRRIDLVRLGAVAGIDPGTSGTIFFDSFVSRRLSYVSAPVLASPADGELVPRENPLNLTWNTLFAATEYYAEFTNGTTISLNSGWISGTSWSPPSQPSGAYTWRVRARDGGGNESLWSAARTLTIRPGIPNNLQGTAASPTQINLSWAASVDAPAGIEGYHVYREGALIETTNSAALNFSDSAAAACSVNHYTVKAYQGAVESADSTLAISPICDLIFSDGFESGTLGAWTSSTTDGGNLSVTGAAALVGSSGLQALINDTNPLYVTDDSPNAEKYYRAFFYVDPGALTMASGDNFPIFGGLQGASTIVLQVQIRFSAGSYQVRAGTLNDAGTWLYRGWVSLSNQAHALELDWQAAASPGANNGALTLWVDDVQQTPLTGIDNDARKIDRARLGAVTGIDAGTSGVLTLDAFVSRRFSLIGTAGAAPLIPLLNSPAVGASVSSSGLNLSWFAPTGASEYAVELTNGTNITLGSGWITGTAWSPGNQPPGAYTWRVKARNSAGESLYSAPRALTITLAAPTSLQANIASAIQVNLGWTASTDATGGIDGYHIYREGVLVGTSSGTLTTYTDASVTDCATYHYTARTFIGLGESVNSNTLTVNIPCDPIFSDRFESGNLSAWTSSTTDGGNLSVTSGAALAGSFGMQALINDANNLFLTDDTPNAESRYRVRFLFDTNAVAMANNDNFVLFYGIQGTSPAVLQVQIRFSGGYQVRAAALNDAGTWVYSAWTTISDAPHLVEMDWQAATAAGANNGMLNLWIDQTQQTPLSGIDNDTRRVDRARLGAVAGIDAGTSGTIFFDSFVSRRVSYVGLIVPTPVLVSPPDTEIVAREITLNLTWGTSPDAAQYDVEFTNGTTISLNSGWSSSSTWSPGSQPAGVYAWRVKARSSSGEESAWSAMNTLAVLPGVPGNLQGSVPAATQVNLTWTASVDAPSGIDGYHVYREGVLIGTTDNSTVSYADTAATPCAVSHYTVRAHLGSVETGDSNTATMNVPCDPIFSDGFEAINLNAWSLAVTDGTNLWTIPGAQLTGSARGLRALINDANPLYVGDDTPNAEARYRARFYFDPNGVTMANNDNFSLFYGFQGTAAAMLQVQLRRSGSTYQLRVGAIDDAGTWLYSGWTTISNAPHIVELDWLASSAASANNGALNWWVDETAQTGLTTLDTDTRRVDRVRLGAVAGMDAGTSGTVYFDAFRSTRFSYIGAEAGGLGGIIEPTTEPTEEVTPEVTVEPTTEVTPEVTAEPTAEVTPEPAVEPTVEVTPEATDEPTIEPTAAPTEEPTAIPVPTETPTPEPTLLPFTLPVFQTMDDGAPLWSASSGWQLSADAAYSGLGWSVLASGQVETLALNVPVTLSAAAPTLSFQSRLFSGALPEVRVSLDGVTWQTVAVITPSLNWALVTVDLSAYAGQTIRLQFVWVSPAGVSESWQVDEVTIADGAILPPVEPTAPAPPVAPGTEPTADAPTVAPRDGAMPNAPADLPQPPTG